MSFDSDGGNGTAVANTKVDKPSLADFVVMPSSGLISKLTHHNREDFKKAVKPFFESFTGDGFFEWGVFRYISESDSYLLGRNGHLNIKMDDEELVLQEPRYGSKVGFNIYEKKTVEGKETEVYIGYTEGGGARKTVEEMKAKGHISRYEEIKSSFTPYTVRMSLQEKHHPEFALLPGTYSCGGIYFSSDKDGKTIIVRSPRDHILGLTQLL